MSERPTPETDAHLLGGSYSFDGDFARKLERERDDAREKLLKLRRMAQELRKLAQDLLDALENCREDSVELLVEWDWKRNAGSRNSAQYEQLKGRVGIADSVIAKAKEVLP